MFMNSWMWTLDPPLAAIPQPNVFCSCGSDLHNGREEFWTIPLYKTVSVQQYSWDVWCEQLSRSCHSISIGLRPGLWLGHSRRRIFFCWSHSVVDLLLSFGLLFCCITQLLLNFNFSGHYPAKYLDKLEFVFPSMIASCPGPEAEKQPQTTMLPPPYFTVGMRFWCLCAVPFFFSTHVVCSFQTIQL